MKTELSLQSQLDPAGLEGSSFITFSMFFQLSILDMLFHIKNVSIYFFFSNFGSQLAPLGGGVRELIFSSFFEIWAVLGPKCLQELPQEPPEPPQASIFTDL